MAIIPLERYCAKVGSVRFECEKSPTGFQITVHSPDAGPYRTDTRFTMAVVERDAKKYAEQLTKSVMPPLKWTTY